MDSTWKWKIWGIIGSIVLGIYALVPTVLQFPQERELLELKQQPVPWYFDLFPEKGLNLGLDLRGGIYIEMDVMVEDGLATKIDLLAQDLLRDLKRRDIIPTTWSQSKDHDHLELVFKNEGDVQAALALVQKDYLKRGVLKRGLIVSSEQGTVHFPADPGYLDQIRKDIVSQAVQAVRNRIDRYGLTEPTVQRQGTTRLIVELPGVKDPERALKIIKQAGKLEFKLVNNSLDGTSLGNLIASARETAGLPTQYSAEDVKTLNTALRGKLPEGTNVAFELTRNPETGKITQAKPYLLNDTVYITGDMLKNAQVQIDSRSSQPYVSLTFNAVGAKNFADLTTAHTKEYLAILLDGNVSSAPQIREPIRNGECRIDLGLGTTRDAVLQEARDLTLVLQEGALPASLKETTKTVIGPSLGADSIKKSLNSLLAGAFVVILFMFIYYRLSGILANIALIINALFIFAFLAMFQATLTLPGMAGIVLTIGMAVDANVLIFERIRQELRAGQKPKGAVESGYSNAVRAIMDSNLTTIIAGIILYQFGTGPIKGFAVTLMIGLVCNLFTAIVVTRTVYEYFILKRKIERISI